MNKGGGKKLLSSYGSMNENTLHSIRSTDCMNDQRDDTFRNHDPLQSNVTNQNTEVDGYRLIEERYDSFISTTSSSSSTSTSQQQPYDGTDPMTTKACIIAGSVANLCSATLGAGVLALPFAMYQAGIIVGTILLVSSAIATIYSIDLIVMACHIYQVNTYEALTEQRLGKRMKSYVELSIIVFSLGCAVAYIIAVGDIVERSLLLINNSRSLTMCIIWAIAMVPLSMLHKMQNLQFASVFGIASIGTLLIAMTIHLLQDLYSEKEDKMMNNNNFKYDDDYYHNYVQRYGTNPIEDDVKDGEYHHHLSSVSKSLLEVLYTCLWPSNGWNSVLTACPIILFAFSCQCNVCSIYVELPTTTNTSNDKQQETQIQSNNQFNRTNSCNTTITEATSSPNLFDGGTNLNERRETEALLSTSEKMISTNPDESHINETINTTPLQQPSSNQEQSSTSLSSSSSSDVLMHTVTIWAVGICATLYTFISYIALADFGTTTTPNILSCYRPTGVMQIAMSAMALCVVMAFPLNIFPARVTICNLLVQTKFDHYFFQNKIEIPSTTNSSTTTAARGSTDNTEGRIIHHLESMEQAENNNITMNCSNPTEDPSSTMSLLPRDETIVVDSTTGNEVTNSSSTNRKKDEDCDVDDLDFNWKRHVFITMLLTGLTLGLALALPNISVVFGLLGGTASSFLGFVVPGLLGLQLCVDLFDNITTENEMMNNNPSTGRNNTESATTDPRPTTTNNTTTSTKSTATSIFRSRRRLQIISWSLIIGGICIGLLTTAVTFYNTVLVHYY